MRTETELLALVKAVSSKAGSKTLCERICSAGISENIKAGNLKRASEAADTLTKHHPEYSKN